MVEADFHDVVDAEQRQAWGDARTALERAKGRLGDGGPAELRQRTGQIERELALVETLQQIRSSRSDPVLAAARISQAISAYEAAFRQAGLIDRRRTPQSSRHGFALRASRRLSWSRLTIGPGSTRADATGCTRSRAGQPNPTSRQVRDPKVWDNLHALEAFARSMPR